MAHKRILVTGPRWFDDVGVIGPALERALEQIGEETALLVHGNCRGVDKTAAAYWEARGRPTMPYDAAWSLGNFAGPARNELMTKDGAAVCVAFMSTPISRGSADCVRRAKERDIPIRTFLIGAEPS